MNAYGEMAQQQSTQKDILQRAPPNHPTKNKTIEITINAQLHPNKGLNKSKYKKSINIE